MNRALAFGVAAWVALGVGEMGAALAADLPVKAAPVPIVAEFNWSGVYVGAQGGWSDDRLNWAYNPAVVGGVRQTNAYNFNEGFWGVHAGAQYQWQHFVLGIEGSATTNDASWQSFTCPNPSEQCQARWHDLWTVGGRAGYAWKDFLFYGSGGYASAATNTRAVFTPTGAIFEQTQARHDGWYAGLGIDYVAYKSQLASIILGLEYQHIDIGTQFHCVSPCTIPSTLNRNIDGTSDMVRARLSVLFNPFWTPTAVVAKY